MQEPGAETVGGLRAVHLSEVDSTNSWARRLLESDGRIAAGFVVSADSQSAGRGRLGREWWTLPGSLACSVVLPLSGGADEGLGLRIGLASHAVIRDWVGVSEGAPEVRLKWPNDVLISGRKVLGVLTEVTRTAAGTWAIIGVGINLSGDRRSLPESIRQRATTLEFESGRKADLRDILESLVASLRSAVGGSADLIDTIRRVEPILYGVGHVARMGLPDGGELVGTLRGLNRRGMPILETDEGLWSPEAAPELGQSGIE